MGYNAMLSKEKLVSAAPHVAYHDIYRIREGLAIAQDPNSNTNWSQTGVLAKNKIEMDLLNDIEVSMVFGSEDEKSRFLQSIKASGAEGAALKVMTVEQVEDTGPNTLERTEKEIEVSSYSLSRPRPRVDDVVTIHIEGPPSLMVVLIGIGGISIYASTRPTRI